MFNELKRETFVNNDRGFEKFCDMSIKLLNKHTPIKMKYKRDNHMPFITKDLSKAIMKSSQLRNNYLKNKTDSNRIQNNCKNGFKFAFEEIDLASIEKEIHNLKMNKASQISAKIIKENVDIFAEFLWKSINSSIKSSTFRSCLKLADVTPLHKKGKKYKKK